MLAIIKSKVNNNVDIESIITRLADELNTTTEDLYPIILDVIILILDYTNQDKIEYGLRTTLINMIKDYYFLNGYDKLNNDSEDSTNEKGNAKTITLGDTTVTFEDKNKIEINGITYNTGTIAFDKNILIEKYAEELNRHRRMRW